MYNKFGSSISGVDTISYILVSGYGSGGDIGFVVFSWNGGSSWGKNHLIILHIPGLENCREDIVTHTHNWKVTAPPVGIVKTPHSPFSQHVPASDAPVVLPRL